MAQAEATIERIRIDGPVKNTLHDLIQTPSIKLDSAALRPVQRRRAR
jgi:hypothetical protein